MNPEQESAQAQLFNDLVDLTVKYQDKMPVYEFGFIAIQFITKMLLDNAPSEKVALDTVKVSVDEGVKWYQEEKQEDGE